MTIQIYELGDIARILRIEKSLVTNWTIGRPFSVQPSIRASVGKGSRNLFSRNDVYCFALVQRLNEVGAPVAAIQKMLEKVGPRLTDDAFWKDQDWIVINRKGRDFSYDVDFDAEYSANLMLQPEDEVVCVYAINLKFVVDAVSSQIHAFWHQQTASARSRVETGKKGKTLQQSETSASTRRKGTETPPPRGKTGRRSNEARKAKGPVRTASHQ